MYDCISEKYLNTQRKKQNKKSKKTQFTTKNLLVVKKREDGFSQRRNDISYPVFEEVFRLRKKKKKRKDIRVEIQNER